MTHIEIIKPIIDKEKEALLVDGIIKIGKDLSLKSQTINRRQLVDYLNEKYNFSIKEGLYLRDLVKKAYDISSYSESIQKALVYNILENDGKNEVYNPLRVEDNISSLSLEKPIIIANENFTIISLQNKELEKINSIELANNVVDEIKGLKREKIFSVTGNSKVNSYQEFALKIKQGYEKLIITHEYVKDINLNLIADFETTRNKLKLIREDLLSLLIDLFGDSIKTTEPDMFDFSEIQWKNFEDTYPKLDLFFNKIVDEIATFKEIHSAEMKAISMAGQENFNKFLKSTDKITKSRRLTTTDVKGELTVQAIDFAISSATSILKTRSESRKTIAQIELDIEKLKEGMQEDVEKILNDILKLGKLQAEIKDKQIPQLKIFTERVDSLIEDKISPIYKQIIKNKEISSLRDEKVNLTSELRKIKYELVDKNKQLNYSDLMYKELTKLVEEQRFEYDFLLSLFPEEPKWYYKIVSPSNSKKLYNETIKDWNVHCKPFVDGYKELKKGIRKEVELKEEIINDFSKLEARKLEIENILLENSKKINTYFKDLNFSKELLKELIQAVKEVSVSSKGVLEVDVKY